MMSEDLSRLRIDIELCRWSQLDFLPCHSPSENSESQIVEAGQKGLSSAKKNFC